ncbi:MAG: DUF6765 family protein [Eubacterium sp.]
MNLDFHYYATYFAACEAGFGCEQAKEIAWSAQMVDELTPKLAKDKKLEKLENKDYVITCEEIRNNIEDDFSILSDEKNDTLQKVRKIWVPFHFLPGNLPNEDSVLDYTGKKNWGTIEYKERDQKDFACMCRPNSKLAEEMINDTVEKINSQTFKEDKLNLIGIRMHVLADTWAHQFFVGSPNYWVNDVSNVKTTEEIGNTTTPRGISNYEIVYLGHGRIGHLPDLGYAEYSYQPRWSEDKEQIDNEERFLNAYRQMVCAMKCILQNRSFDFEQCEGSTNDNLSVIKDSIDYRSDKEKDICGHWEKVQIRNSKGKEIAAPEKFRVTDNNTKLYIFAKAAKYHRDFVIEKVNKAFPEDNPYFY